MIAYGHAVWQIAAIVDLPLSDADREVWLEAGMPDQEKWLGRPRELKILWLGGARPKWATAEMDPLRASMTTAAARCGQQWHVYGGGRWPQCSCCGEPMPCRAELQDREVESSLAKVAKMESVMPGCCWACREPVTRRQDAVTYDGDNLDLPGAASPQFHTRQQCRGLAGRYEERWLALDPRRERVLTWPDCPGILVVHGDGSSECRSGRGPLSSDERKPERGCQGHLTHNHAVHTACYVTDENYMGDLRNADPCPEKGCDVRNHCGTRTTPRPRRRPSFKAPALPIDAGGAS